jgi:hypothetical protein
MADVYFFVIGSYAQMYKDVRAAVDLCHRDGTLKQAVAHEPSKYGLVPFKFLLCGSCLIFVLSHCLAFPLASN